MSRDVTAPVPVRLRTPYLVSRLLLAVLAGVASGATGARSGFNYTPADTLVWSVPGLLIAPLIGLLLVLSGVRTRRGAAMVTAVTLVVTLLDAILVLVARFGATVPYTATFQWISISIAFTGDSRFQSFGIDLSFRIDHLVLVFYIVALLVALGAVLWQRSVGRQEPGPVRSQVWLLVLVLAGGGVLVSSDLIALCGFWLLAGLASYFLLGNRWGVESVSRGAAVALALPFLGDLALFSAVGMLYSKFGVTEVAQLAPVYGHTAGVSEVYLGIAALLLLGAAVARGALWPLVAWQTSTVDAAPAAAGLVAGVWPLLCGELLFLNLPLFAATGEWTPRIAAWGLIILSLAGPTLALAQFELRRTLLLASSGAIGLCLLAILKTGSAAAALAGLAAIALGRPAMLLGAGWIVEQMRTGDLRFLGGGLTRLRQATFGLGGGALTVAAGAVAASAWRHPSVAWAGPALCLLLVAVALARAWAGAALGPVPARRAFEASRLADPRPGAALVIGALAVLGLIGVLLSFVWYWLQLLVHDVPGSPPIWVLIVWWAPVVVGLAVGTLAAARRRAATLAGQRRLAYLVFLAQSRTRHTWRVVVAGTGLRTARGLELRQLPALESATGRALSTALSGPLRRPGVLTAGALLAVAVGVVLALAGIGGWR
jgi:NADH:ubiquinone oxidoreductase subunit 5 (subunit L)/multisubunit Na+/H+ antiporter MnhA subunit